MLANTVISLFSFLFLFLFVVLNSRLERAFVGVREISMWILWFLMIVVILVGVVRYWALERSLDTTIWVPLLVFCTFLL